MEHELQVETVYVDYYMTAPLPRGSLDGLPESPYYAMARQVPVIRVFGATPAGQKTLVHVHGVLPYFYFRASDEDDQAFNDPKELKRLLPSIAMQLEQQMKDKSTSDRSPDRYIAKLLVVQATPFYGYTPQSKLFVQIFVYNPIGIASIVQLLESESIVNRKFRAYEAHVPYLSQMYADYNIEGMNALRLQNYRVRKPSLLSLEPDENFHVTSRYVPPPAFRKNCFDRQSSCAVEVDVAASHIQNIYTNTLVSQDTNTLTYVPSLAAIWEEERVRRVKRGLPSSPDLPSSMSRDEANGSTPQERSQFLSQSHFQDKMRLSFQKVVKEMKGQAQGTLPATSDTVENVALANAIHPTDTKETNVMDTQSFSYSQYDEDAQDEVYNIQTRHAQEDEEIIKIIQEMHQVEASQSSAESDAENASIEDTSAIEDYDSSSAEEKEQSQVEEEKEMNGILQSQRENETAASREEVEKEDTTFFVSQRWWETPEKLPKIKKRQLTPTKRRSPNKRRRASQPTTPSVVDVEDILSPPPSARTPSRLSMSSQQTGLFVASQPTASSTLTSRPVALFKSTQKVYRYDVPPPSYQELLQSSSKLGITPMKYPHAHYSKASDAPEKDPSYGGIKFSVGPKRLRPFDTSELRCLMQTPVTEHSQIEEVDIDKTYSMAEVKMNVRTKEMNGGKVNKVRTPARLPPSRTDVMKWVSTEKQKENKPSREVSNETNGNTGTVSSSNNTPTSDSTITSNLTLISFECFATSREDFLPNPQVDPLVFVCYAVEAQEGLTAAKTKQQGIIIVRDSDTDAMDTDTDEQANAKVRHEVVESETALLRKVEECVREWDPDFFVGFEVQTGSIGYLVDRAAHLEMNFIQSLSRLPYVPMDPRNVTLNSTTGESANEKDKQLSIGTTWGMRKTAGLWIHGRHILNLWRMARSELKLARYPFEIVVKEVMGIEFPVYSSQTLTTWYHARDLTRWKTIRHILRKARMNLRLLKKMELITRTSQMARLFGMDFYSVLSRGSQFRVESVLLRVTKRLNYLLLSPSRQQVASQAPMECIPLVMEPHSGFYSDPVLVLDFQSLYPSLVIAYNLCYSTFLGRLENGLDEKLESHLGVLDSFSPSIEGLCKNQDQANLSGNGGIFTSNEYRRGVVPVVLHEILKTRIMVKEALKQAKARGEKKLEKVLNARQLALKMIANVTYGYTAAGFSGRMPCAQLADAIVQTGRNTLEAAVRMVESNADWNARVVYGDTDSIFVQLPGRSKEEAFRIGAEIADSVTEANPAPVKLQLEKVYMGCVLVSKKRYAGRKFEKPTGTGEVESKGLEIVRRDSCGVVQTSMHRSLSILFATSDLSQVKRSLQTFWKKVLRGEVALKEFVFAKEVRLGTYTEGREPPAAIVSLKQMKKDARREPRWAERVPYVVVNGPPGARLMDLVVSPHELDERSMNNRKKKLTLNYQYYIHKQIIPALEREFAILGADVAKWYREIPRPSTKALGRLPAPDTSLHPTSAYSKYAASSTIDDYYSSKHCVVCGKLGTMTACKDCLEHPQRSILALCRMTSRREMQLEQWRKVCWRCDDRMAFKSCMNVSCQVWNNAKLARESNDRIKDELDTTLSKIDQRSSVQD